MCDSVGDTKRDPPRRQTTKPHTNACIKCKTAKPTIDIRNTRYCKPCFINATVYKFRSSMHKSHERIQISLPTNVLVAYSGGPSSSALVKLMSDYYSVTNKHEKTRKYSTFTIAHIDESALFPGSQESKINDIVDKLGLPYVSAKLEDLFSSDAIIKLIDPRKVQIKVDHNDSKSPTQRLKDLFEALDLTSREDMLVAIKNALLMDLAERTHSQLLLVGDSATRTAVKAVSGMSKGRGGSLSFEVGPESSWSMPKTLIFRPLRECIAKEIAYFNYLTGQTVVHTDTFVTGAPRNASIDRLTESFVVELDLEFPSTVPTVCRTAQKLCSSEATNRQVKCLVCGLAVGKGASEWRERLTVNGTNVPDETNNDGCGLKELVCYACQNTLRSIKKDSALPVSVAWRLATCDQLKDCDDDTTRSQEYLREQIKEFFI